MNLTLLKSAFLGACLTLSSFTNAGIMNFEGEIETATQVDHWSFDVTTAGTFTFDVLAFELKSTWFTSGNDHFNNGTANDRLDSHVYLFDLDSNNTVGSDNNVGLVTFLFSTTGQADGSTSHLDSYLETYLSEGSYLFAIGDFYLSEADALNGYNNDNYIPGVGNYNVTVSSDDGVASITEVPEPSTIAMLGLIALGFTARKAKK